MSSRQLGRVYVTGADGFIGSHLVERLVEEGYPTTALCIYNSLGRYGWLDKLAARSPQNLHCLLGDIRDPYFLTKTIAGHQTVFHLASLIAIPYSYQAPQSYVETNVLGTMHVAQAALQAGASRMVHTSTSEVYGSAQFVPITEAHPLQGQSPYSASKIGADMIVQSFVKSFSLPATTLRPFNTYGPRQSLRAVIPTVIAQICSGREEISLGSITPTRDFNYVSDTVAAFMALGQSRDEALIGKTFNAGSGREIAIGDLVSLIARLANRSCRIKSEDERMRPEASEVQRLLADSSALQKATGWRPKVSLESGLSAVIEWVNSEAPAVLSQNYHI